MEKISNKKFHDQNIRKLYFKNQIHSYKHSLKIQISSRIDLPTIIMAYNYFRQTYFVYTKHTPCCYKIKFHHSQNIN